MTETTKSRTLTIIEQMKTTWNLIPARIVLTILGFFGFVNLYAMRVNLSVAMVAMVGKPEPGNETNETEVTCPNLIIHSNLSTDNETYIGGEFDWDSGIQGQVLGSFFYGYLITQIPGGILAEKYGAKWIYGFGILITSIFTLLTPLAARWNVWALVAVRVIEGCAGGVAFPAMNVLIARWVPKIERSRIATAMNMGIQVGIVTTNVVSGILCESDFLNGWPSVFYILGFIGCVWFVFWAILVHESPDTHPRISKAELDYIKSGQDKATSGNIKIPWKQIWTSVPLWAIIVAHFGENWVFYTLLTMMPTYFSNVLHFDLKQNGMISGLPYLMMASFAIPASFVADALRASGRLKITTIRKIINSLAFYGAAICTLAIALVGCEPMIIIILFSLFFGLNGMVLSGYIVNHVDMCPQFAGTLFGITNGIATLPGFLAPAFTGKILESGHSLRNWGIVFITTSAIHVVSGTFYNIFASAEVQSWNAKQEGNKEMKINSLSPTRTVSKESEQSRL